MILSFFSLFPFYYIPLLNKNKFSFLLEFKNVETAIMKLPKAILSK